MVAEDQPRDGLTSVGLFVGLVLVAALVGVAVLDRVCNRRVARGWAPR
jgi:hypothetical protein